MHALREDAVLGLVPPAISTIVTTELVPVVHAKSGPDLQKKSLNRTEVDVLSIGAGGHASAGAMSRPSAVLSKDSPTHIGLRR